MPHSAPMFLSHYQFTMKIGLSHARRAAPRKPYYWVRQSHQSQGIASNSQWSLKQPCCLKRFEGFANMHDGGNDLRVVHPQRSEHGYFGGKTRWEVDGKSDQ